MERTWQPAYDYDADGCYPTPAIGPDGTVNGGLNPTGSLSGECHDTSDLDNTNGYSRYKCNNRVVRDRLRSLLRKGPGTRQLKLVNRATGKCLDVYDWSTADAGEVLQWACTGADNQRWQVEPLGDGTSTDIRLWTWLNNYCQQWSLQP